MRSERSAKERLISLTLNIGCVVVSLVAVSSVVSLDFNEEVAADMRAAREAADDGDFEVAFDLLLTVMEKEPESVGALRSAACLALDVDRGELVPLLLSDLLRAGWNWQKVSIGCEEEALFRTLFDVLRLPGAAVVIRVPNAEDEPSLSMENEARALLADAPEEVDQPRIAQVYALAACVNERHGLSLMAKAQVTTALSIDRSAMSALPDAGLCTEVEY